MKADIHIAKDFFGEESSRVKKLRRVAEIMGMSRNEAVGNYGTRKEGRGAFAVC